MKISFFKAASLWLAVSALGILADPVLRADDNIRVDVVVNTTTAYQGWSKASPKHPVYYFPWTAGYIELGQILPAQKPPPPSWQVQHLIAVALAKHGYLVTHKANPPSIVLILWWGYLAPVMWHPFGEDLDNGNVIDSQGGGMTMAGIGISAGDKSYINSPAALVPRGATAAEAMGPGSNLPAFTILVTPNDHEMLEMVAGDRFEDYTGRDRVDLSTNEIHEAAHNPRYFLMVSALDFNAATQKKAKLLWCARVSTEMIGRDLADVLPTLIEVGAAHFGEETGGPRFITSEQIPLGRVDVGPPVLKATYPAKP